jgi:hypothetical protein
MTSLNRVTVWDADGGIGKKTPIFGAAAGRSSAISVFKSIAVQVSRRLHESPESNMPTRQERRDSERVPCKLVVHFELMKPVDRRTAKFLEGHGHAINRSVGGMLLLLPGKVSKRQVVEIHVPSKTKKKQSVKLVEVCWTRSIPVSARDKIYLAGTRFLFELPAPSQSPQAR